MPVRGAAVFPSVCLFLSFNIHAAGTVEVPQASQAAQQQQTSPVQQAGPAQQPSPAPQQQKPGTPQQQNPFENVPAGTEKQPQPANPSNIQEAKPATVGDNIIEGVDFRGQPGLGLFPFNPARRSSGRRSCRTDRSVPCALAPKRR